MIVGTKIDAAIDGALGHRVVGAVVLINRRGRRIYQRAAGYRDRELAAPMPQDAIFRLASVTKPMVATAILRLVDAGRIGLDDPIAQFLPYFTPALRDGSRPTIRIRDLLTHTSGLIGYGDVPDNVSPGISGPIISLDENLRRLAMTPLAAPPATTWEYGMAIDVLGGVLAAVENTTLQGALDRLVLGPLGMKDTRFGVTDMARLATPYWDGRPPTRVGTDITIVNADGTRSEFQPGRILNPDAPQSGGGGIAGTADDVMQVIDLYHTGGTILSPDTARMARANQIGAIPRRAEDAGKSFSFIGAVITDAAAAKSPCPVGTVDWGGVWGHNWILDPINALTIVVCTNTTPEGCNGPFREDIRDAVYAALAAGELDG